MKKLTFTLSLFLMLILATVCPAQDHIITLSGIEFSPANLTINAGETVMWDNTGGTHNVNGSLQDYPDNPEGFLSGTPTSAPWAFSHTFTIPGTYNYQCDQHVSFGMTGTITVMGGGSANEDVIITEIMYNNPGADDYEFVEIYNRGTEAVDMEGWTLSDAVDFTFPAFTLDPDSYVLVVTDAVAFETAFGIMPFEFSGALNNTGEPIKLHDNMGAFVDSVEYSDSAPWYPEADGTGPSLQLCDYDADNNDPANWAPSITPTGVEVGGIEILATPGADSECPAGPVIGFLNNGFTVLEDAGIVFAQVAMSNGDANTTEVTVEINVASTATSGDDFTLTLPMTITFDAGVTNDTQTVAIDIVDDVDIEVTETLTLDLSNPTNNGEILPNQGQFTLTILDDDTPLSNALVISGVFDTQPAGAGAKGIELKATADIPDLSIFGVGSANNGTGPSSVETQLPAISVNEGDCIYVTSDSLDFIDFFGFSPTIEGDAANINGDDAIELFENNIVIDVFGDVFTDGTGEPWEYLDGWVYRVSGTGPDGSIFELDHWTFSGIDVFDDVPNNASAPVPFPTCSYSVTPPMTAVANDDNVTIDINETIVINILGNDVTPNDLTSITITSDPANGTATVNGLEDITYTPDTDFCGTDMFTYELCDAEGCDNAVVSITINCPPSYPAYDIATVTTVDDDGLPDSLGRSVQLQGIVHGVDLQGNDNIQFSLIDGTGGISLFSSDNFGYTVTEGDELVVQGTITEFNCLTQITPDTLFVVSSGNPLVTPEVTTFLDESFESELVQLNNLTLVDPAAWAGDGSSFNVQVTNGTFTNTMRIDNDTELSTMPAPDQPFHAIGLGGQFDNEGACDEGYQFLPRYAEDIIPLDNTGEEMLKQQISFFPNPVRTTLFVRTDLTIDEIVVSNLLGQPVALFVQPGNRLEVNDLQPGVYLLTFRVDELSWTRRFVKK